MCVVRAAPTHLHDSLHEHAEGRVRDGGVHDGHLLGGGVGGGDHHVGGGGAGHAGAAGAAGGGGGGGAARSGSLRHGARRGRSRGAARGRCGGAGDNLSGVADGDAARQRPPEKVHLAQMVPLDAVGVRRAPRARRVQRTVLADRTVFMVA
jgi:hypothetical protein